MLLFVLCALAPRRPLCAEDSPEELLERARQLREEAAALELTLTPQRPEPPQPLRRSRLKDDTPLTLLEMRDAGLQRSVKRQMVNAFDNLPPQESGDIFETVWAKGPSKQVEALARLAAAADDLEEAYLKQRVPPEVASEEIRVLRSRIRMASKLT